MKQDQSPESLKSAKELVWGPVLIDKTRGQGQAVSPPIDLVSRIVSVLILTDSK